MKHLTFLSLAVLSCLTMGSTLAFFSSGPPAGPPVSATFTIDDPYGKTFANGVTSIGCNGGRNPAGQEAYTVYIKNPQDVTLGSAGGVSIADGSWGATVTTPALPGDVYNCFIYDSTGTQDDRVHFYVLGN